MPSKLQSLDLISLPYKFNIVDGRSISGTLIAIDDQSNLLVANATELQPESEKNGHPKSPIIRELGLISIPKQHITKVFVDKLEYEKTIRYVELKKGKKILNT